MMKMCRYALITALAIFLAGCAGLREQPAPVEEAKPQPQQPAQPQPTVPTVPAVPSVPGAAGPIEHQDQQSGQPAPRVRHYDWNGAVQPLVGQMLQASGVNAGSILLVDSVNNRTNGSLNAGEATTALRSALAGNGKFTGYRRSSWRSPSSSWACRRRTASAAAAKPWASPATWARSMCFTPMPPATSTRLS